MKVTNAKELAKGDKVIIEGNEIFQMMGMKKVTGTVFCFHGDNSGFSIKCDQTHAIEGCDFGDGTIEKVE